MSTAPRPWYGEPMVWLVLSPVILTLILGSATIVWSARLGGAAALPGEYTRTGKLIALDAAAQQRSEELAPLASARLDPDAGELRVRIDAPALPEVIGVLLVHATLPARDVRLDLRRRGESWVASLPARIPERGQLHLFPGDAGWRLVAPLATGRDLRFSPLQR